MEGAHDTLEYDEMNSVVYHPPLRFAEEIIGGVGQITIYFQL